MVFEQDCNFEASHQECCMYSQYMYISRKGNIDHNCQKLTRFSPDSCCLTAMINLVPGHNNIIKVRSKSDIQFDGLENWKLSFR